MLPAMPTPLLAEFDPVQIAIVVIAMVGGFVHWLWNLIMQSKEEAEQRRQPRDPEEEKRREEAWRRQTQNPSAPRPSPASPPPVHDPFATVRDIFEQIKREAQGAPPPVPRTPPPLPPTPAPPARRGTVTADLPRGVPPYQQPRRHSVAAEVAARAPASATPPVNLPAAPPPPPAPALPAVATLTARPALAPAWTGLLGSPAALRQAFILREILGPPKALQTAEDSAA